MMIEQIALTLLELRFLIIVDRRSCSQTRLSNANMMHIIKALATKTNIFIIISIDRDFDTV
jgi:hypothetical protein